jgi:outer membrane protein TolC
MTQLFLNRVRMFLGSVAVCLPVVGAAQSSSSGSGQSPQAQQVPLSGRAQGGGSVSAQQTASGSASSSVDTVNTTIQVQGPYQGSIAGAVPGDGPIRMTFPEALQRGLQYNLGGLDSAASVKQLRAQRLSALSQLLPNIYATVSETGAKTDLQTLGLSSGTFGGNIALPVTVGPYHYYSAQANVSEQLSLTSLHNLRSAESLSSAALLSARDARELIVLAVGGSYLRVLATQALVASQEAQVRYSEASYKQAEAQFEAGTKAQVDATRSFVELQTQQQRLSSQQAQLLKDQMSLSRLIGLPLDRPLLLSETLPATAPEMPLAEQALKEGWDHRADLQAAGLQLKAAQQSLRASRAEYLPSLSVNGSFGVQGVDPNKGANVFQASASLNIPIWSSGRTRSQVQQAEAAVSQRTAEFEDQKGVVENDVRTAILDLQVSAQQVKVADSNRQLALSILKQSQDRFAAGVATSVEVVQSQESLASAELDFVNSLFSLNVGRIKYARAAGQAEQTVPDLLK